MSAITIRLSASDREVVEAAKALVGQSTASKALLECARRHPDLLARVRRLEEGEVQLEADLARLRRAVEEWRMAAGREEDARAELARLVSGS